MSGNNKIIFILLSILVSSCGINKNKNLSEVKVTAKKYWDSTGIIKLDDYWFLFDYNLYTDFKTKHQLKSIDSMVYNDEVNRNLMLINIAEDQRVQNISEGFIISSLVPKSEFKIYWVPKKLFLEEIMLKRQRKKWKGQHLDYIFLINKKNNQIVLERLIRRTHGGRRYFGMEDHL